MGRCVATCERGSPINGLITIPHMMPPYPVMCYAAGCPHLAAFKIAARWSDGLTVELKTYSLACEKCLPQLFARSVSKQAECRLAPGETLESPGIYDLHRGDRDHQLARRPDLEQSLTTASIPSA